MVGKSAIFVLSRVMVWGSGPHLPIQGYIEFPPPPGIYLTSRPSVTCEPEWKFAFKLQGVLAINRMATQPFNQRRHNKAAFFFRLNFYVYADVENRESARARARDKKQRSGSSLAGTTRKFYSAAEKTIMVADTKVKMSSGEHEHKQQHLSCAYTKFPP